MSLKSAYDRTERLVTRLCTNFFLQFLLSLLLNFWLAIPAVVFIALYYNGIWPIWPFWVALAAWILIVLLGLIFARIMFRFARMERESDRIEKPNRNPYSAKIEYPAAAGENNTETK